jgi:drug/metabolite transporter (DMT)-like permease
MGIALGVAAGLCWGANDYVIAIATRRAGVLPALVAFHVMAAAVLGGLVLATGAWTAISLSQALVVVLAGVLGSSGYLAYFRALQLGPISVVSPVISGYSAFTVILAVVILGDRLNAPQVAAIALALLGVVVASVDPHAIAGARRIMGLGMVMAVLTLLLVGGFVFSVSVDARELGWLLPIFLARGMSCVLLAGVAAPGRRWRIPAWTPGLAGILALVGLLDTAGYAAFNLGVRDTETSLVAAASAPYAIVPIVMGIALFSERPAWTQRSGAAAIIAGIVLLGVVS